MPRRQITMYSDFANDSKRKVCIEIIYKTI